MSNPSDPRYVYNADELSAMFAKLDTSEHLSVTEVCTLLRSARHYAKQVQVLKDLLKSHLQREKDQFKRRHYLVAEAYSIRGASLFLRFYDGVTPAQEIDLLAFPLPPKFSNRYAWAISLYCRTVVLAVDDYGNPRDIKLAPRSCHGGRKQSEDSENE